MRRLTSRMHHGTPRRHDSTARTASRDEGSVLILALVVPDGGQHLGARPRGVVLDQPPHHDRLLLGPRAPGRGAQHDGARDAEHPLRTELNSTRTRARRVACWGNGTDLGADQHRRLLDERLVLDGVEPDERRDPGRHVLDLSELRVRRGVRGEPVPPGRRHLRRLPARGRRCSGWSVHRLELVRPGDDRRQLDLGIAAAASRSHALSRSCGRGGARRLCRCSCRQCAVHLKLTNRTTARPDATVRRTVRHCTGSL